MSLTTRHKSLRHALALLAVALLGSPASATDSTPELSPWRFAGYGTLSRSWDTRDSLAPIRDVSQRPADGFATGPTWKLDSRIGVQLAYRFSPNVEAVAQIVGRDQVSSELHHAVELGYLDFQLPRDLRLRLGRVGFDGYLMSDHRNLGYAYAWVRPPVEFYGWTPMYFVDGGDISLELSQGDTHWRLRAQAGKNDFVTPMGQANFNFHGNMTGLSLLREAGPWRLKASYTTIYSTKEVEPLAAFHSGLTAIANLGLPGVSSEAAFLRRETSFDNQRMRYLTLGAAYDDGLWIAQAEFGTNRTTAIFTPAATTAYAVVGRRFGAFTPYTQLSASRPVTKVQRPGPAWPGAAAALQSMAYGNVINDTRVDQDTLALGVRWDFDTRAALKLQWDHTRIHPRGYASWFRDQAVQERSTRINLLTMSLDFVF